MNDNRQSDIYHILTPPYKRTKGNDGTWKPGPTGQVISAVPQSASPTVDNERAREDRDERGRSSTSVKPGATPSRSPYLNLIHDALLENPNGLSTHDIFEWTRTCRPQTFRKYDEQKLKRSIAQTLSSQADKKRRTVWQYKVETEQGSSSLWKLDNDAPLVGSSPIAPTVTVTHKGWRPRETNIHLSNNTRTSKPSRAPEVCSPGLQAPCLPTGSALANGGIERNGASTLPVEPAPPLSNDHVENLLSVAASQDGEAIEGLNGKESDLSAANGESPGNPVSAHTLQETTQELVTAEDDSNGEAVSHGTLQGHDALDDQTEQDSREQIRLGKMVEQLREWKVQRKRMRRDIETESKDLPDVNTLKEGASRASEKAAELARLANEARQVADAACANFEIAQDKADNIAAAKLKIEKIDQDSKQVREELGID